jgi:hypothetical protein
MPNPPPIPQMAYSITTRILDDQTTEEGVVVSDFSCNLWGGGDEGGGRGGGGLGWGREG